MASKILENDLLNKGVLGMADKPGLSAKDMQYKFEEIQREIIIPKLNEVIGEVGSMLSPFDNEKTYAVGEYCIYKDELYKCIDAVTIPGTWNDKKWGGTTLSDALKDLQSQVDNAIKESANAVAEEAAARKAEIAIERARIDSIAKLPEGSTTGDAELIDGRVDYKGNTHTNIGEHIREVSSQLSGEIVKNSNNFLKEIRTGYSDFLFPKWEIGSIQSNGIDADSTVSTYPYSIRSVGYVKVPIGKAIIKPNGFYIGILEYSSEDFSVVSKKFWIYEDTEYTFNEFNFYRIVIYDNVNKNQHNLAWADMVEFVWIPNNYLQKQIDKLNETEVKYTVLYVGSEKTYTTLKKAIDSITNPNKYNVYDIYLDEGTYNTLDGYDLSQQTSDFIGLTLPDYVNLYGVGSPEKVILYAELPVDISSYNFTRDSVSTINVWKNNTIKNLTIKAKNIRYACHNDDYKRNAVENAIEYFENVIFKYLNNDDGIISVSQPFGSGAYNGRKTQFINCVFVNEMQKGHACYIHNNTDSPNCCEWYFENCDFEGALYSLGLSSAGSGQTEIVTVNGCYFEKDIRFSKQSSYTESTNEYSVRGYGNNDVSFTYKDITEDIGKIRLL